MSTSFDNEEFPFGSARMAGAADAARLGLFRRSDEALYCGALGGRPLWYHGEGGVLKTAGARAGKFRDLLAYLLCKGTSPRRNIVMLDPKGEGAAVSHNQVVADGKTPRVITFNPCGLHGLPQHKINPLGALKWSSPTLIPDLKLMLETWIPKSGAPQGEYFELNARRWAEAICLTLVKMNGVLELGPLYRIVNLLSGGGKEYLDFAFEMYRSGIDLSRDVEEEIAAMRADRSGGFQGIIGELQKAFACLSDPLLAEAVSGPFDFELSELCSSETFSRLFLMVPPEMLSFWGPVLRSLFAACLIEKSRKPNAPRQLWLLDECGQIGRFPMIPQMFTFGAGIGIQPVAVFQSMRQMEELSPGAGQLITSSAGLQISFGVRDQGSAKNLSDLMGTETLQTDDTLIQGRAQLKREDLIAQMLSGADPFDLARHLAQAGRETSHVRKQGRSLRTPDEIRHLGSDQMILVMDGLPGPLLATRRPYWTNRALAGTFLPNPYHPPHDRVQVKTRFGMRSRKVIREAVPEEYAHLPQYRDGVWTYVEGYRP